MIRIDQDDLLYLVMCARRYCDKRSTPAPYEFNKIYEKIISEYPEVGHKDDLDKTLLNKGEFWPYAQDGMYNPVTGSYDALKFKYIRPSKLSKWTEISIDDQKEDKNKKYKHKKSRIDQIDTIL